MENGFDQEEILMPLFLIEFKLFLMYDKEDKGEAPNMFFPQPLSVINNINSLLLFISILHATTSSTLYRLGKA